MLEVLTSPTASELGAVAAGTAAILGVVFHFLLKRAKANPVDERCELALAEIKKTVEEAHRLETELHDWHALEDDDGVRRMYFPRSIERTLERLAESMEASNKIQAEVLRVLQSMQGE